jgi:hypothetical protein
MSLLSASLSCDWEWIYSEAGHGKGPADGVGAALKRQADAFVAHGGNVETAADIIGLLTTSSIAFVKEVFDGNKLYADGYMKHVRICVALL